MFSSFGVSTNNAFERLTFVNAKPVYFPPMERKWASDNGGSTSYRTAAYRDKDGSLGGGPNSYVLIHDGVNDSIAVDTEACEIKPTWNAAVCRGDVGRMNFGGAGGGFGARGGGAPRAGGAAPARGGAAGPGATANPGAAGPGVAGRGGPGAAAGPGAPGRRGGGAGLAAQPPVVLSRNGKEFTVTGGTNVRAGTEIKVTTERPSVSLTLMELDRGSWVIFELPGFTTAASGAPQNSLDALRQASATSYYKGQDSLWVKVVSSGDAGNGAPGGGTSLQVSR
jgi:cell migration-inducing and hyaluronan-binding protein